MAKTRTTGTANQPVDLSYDDLVATDVRALDVPGIKTADGRPGRVYFKHLPTGRVLEIITMEDDPDISKADKVRAAADLLAEVLTDSSGALLFKGDAVYRVSFDRIMAIMRALLSYGQSEGNESSETSG